MSLFSDNIRALRIKKDISQGSIAKSLEITRERYVKYEYGTSEAPYDILKRIANFYHISIDLLLSVDVRKIPTDNLLKLEDNRLVLPITVDGKGENQIEVVTQKVKAGYLMGYSDPEYIERLEHVSLPFLVNGKFRAFPVDGDSMPPHRDGALIVGRYLENLSEIADGKTYVLLTENDGVVYKRMRRSGEGRYLLSSDNDFYAPYEIDAGSILEVWAYAASIATHELEPDDLSPQSIREMFLVLKREIEGLKNS
ncbi:XRE family transcriptional regulator [Flavobacterium lindanitolerans]|uniref:XRE family transcriptional regulator n=1 Tax=Flavobacterium lindanitolerans TaxID=428988 RepID=UPI0023F17A58|nr:helix-turn-helix domain-containing protein [Flavobacterium lindanitolerans]